MLDADLIPSEPDVAIVGGGVAGLSCARYLDESGIDWVLLEASDRLGGRVKTDLFKGFKLDHGFQVLLTAYPELPALLDLERLEPGSFISGARIRFGDKFHTYADPLRVPRHALSTILSPVGTIKDKIALGMLKWRLQKESMEVSEAASSRSTLDYLHDLNFSNEMIDRFFRPFFGGIFLEKELSTPYAMFEFVFSMFSSGLAALPADGIQAVATEISRDLDHQRLFANSAVEALENHQLIMESGGHIKPRFVVIAANWVDASRLLGKEPLIESHPVSCHYFSVPESEGDSKWLYLNGEARGLINNLCFPSAIVRSYAPEDRHLLSVTTLDAQETNIEEIKKELVKWFGEKAQEWQFLKSYSIRQALPRLNSILLSKSRSQIDEAIYSCGDYTANPSLNGALMSGRLAATEIIKELNPKSDH